MIRTKLDSWLKATTKKLEQAGIGTARLDALVLLEDVTGRDRARLLAHPETEISAVELAKLNKLLKHRAEHEPLAYLRGKTEFYGREFIITSAVLVPRPESETIIDLLKKLPRLPSPLRIADVGTGSGVLGITAALELPNAQVELLEIDEAALKVAKTNVDKFTLTISIRSSDLLSSSNNNNDILLCNLPYVPDNLRLNSAATHEPKAAIFGGPDGLDLYRKLFEQVPKLPKQPLYILCECLPAQQPVLADLASTAGYKQFQAKSFIQIFTPTKIASTP